MERLTNLSIEVMTENGDLIVLNISPSAFSLNPEIRKLVFRAARNEDPNATEWLWVNYKLKEMTQREIDLYNSKN